MCMKKIVIGCPYQCLNNLKESLVLKKNEGDFVFDTEDIEAMDFENIYLRNGEVHAIDSLTAAFVRYPYDLIPPHTETYSLREKTESLKTYALLFDSVSVNKISDNFKTRNRMWSLKTAKVHGLLVPNSVLLSAVGDSDREGEYITKSLGNCFYSDSDEAYSDDLKQYLSYEEDGGDKAYIYSPHKISSGEVNDHVEKFGVCFIQDFVNKPEYRIFIVGEDIFAYKREVLEKVDNSAGSLIKSTAVISDFEKQKLLSFAKDLNLGYLCLDVFIDEETKEITVIDVNPFGSMPKYDKHPEVIDSVAELLLNR